MSIPICSDFRSETQTLGLRVQVKLGLVQNCKKVMTELAECNDVSLMWILGHTGIKGNVKAAIF